MTKPIRSLLSSTTAALLGACSPQGRGNEVTVAQMGNGAPSGTDFNLNLIGQSNVPTQDNAGE
jgi:hypothetical protein